MDHCPAAKKRKQEQDQCEEQTPWLTEKPTPAAVERGECSLGLLSLDDGGGTVQGCTGG